MMRDLVREEARNEPEDMKEQGKEDARVRSTRHASSPTKLYPDIVGTERVFLPVNKHQQTVSFNLLKDNEHVWVS